MNTTLNYLEQLKSTYGDASDYKAAQLLDIQSSAIRAYRRGRARMGDATAVKLAQLLELPPNHVVADLHIEKAKSDEEKAFWEAVRGLDFPMKNGH